MIIIGVMLMISGMVTMILSNWKRAASRTGIWSLQGMFNLLIGLIFITSPTVMVKVFVIFLGVILFIMGLVQLIGAIGMLSRTLWAWIFFIIALLTLASGVFLLSDPFKSAETILPFLGALLVLNGVSGLFMAFKAGRQPQTYHGATVQDVTYEEVE